MQWFQHDAWVGHAFLMVATMINWANELLFIEAYNINIQIGGV